MLKYPICISPTGSLQLSDDPERDRILMLLDTWYWERVMVPDYGCPIAVFDPIADTGDVVSALTLALGYWVGDGIQVSVIGEDSAIEQGVLQIRIDYGSGTGQVEYTIDRSQLAASGLGL